VTPRRQRVEEHFDRLQIERVEAFSDPAVNAAPVNVEQTLQDASSPIS
jgi:hypothetical protein